MPRSRKAPETRIIETDRDRKRQALDSNRVTKVYRSRRGRLTSDEKIYHSTLVEEDIVDPSENQGLDNLNDTMEGNLAEDISLGPLIQADKPKRISVGLFLLRMLLPILFLAS